MTDWLSLDQTYLMSTVNRLPIVVDKAEGNYLYEENGKKYLDLFTGLGVNLLGHSHPKLLKALQEQSEKFIHISNLLLNKPAIQLAERLANYVFGKDGGRVYFSNSGAEATEALIKLLSKWNQQNEHKSGIVVLKNSFHGRTLGALRLTRQPNVYQDFPQLPVPIYEVEVNKIEDFTSICQNHSPLAVFIEPILGAGGVQPLNKDYIEQMYSICKKQNILFCVDEIQTGIGRTGSLFAYEHYFVQPDILLFAKIIGGGLPLGGIIAREPIASTFQPGDHGTTFAPSPLAASLGNTLLEMLLDDKMLEKAASMIEELWSTLYQLEAKYPPIIQQIRGKGLMIGIQTHLEKHVVTHIQRQLLDQGILVDITAGNVIRLLPSLLLASEEISYFGEKLDSIFQKL